MTKYLHTQELLQIIDETQKEFSGLQFTKLAYVVQEKCKERGIPVPSLAFIRRLIFAQK
jgi:hypothetical protein